MVLAIFVLITTHGGDMEDNLMYYGGAVKALGDGKVAGYLVRYSDENTPDLQGDFFSSETDLGIEAGSRVPVYYQHGLDPIFKTKRISRATAEFQDVGVWLETQLEMRDEYERALYELAEAGKLGWSSGAAGHLVEKVLVGKSYFIKSWPIAEASLTPTPAEPRNTAISVKSLLQKPEQLVSDNKEDTMAEEAKPEVKQEQPVIDIQKIIDQTVAKTIEEIRKAEPQVKAGVQVIEDEADKALRVNPFTPTEFFKAVYVAAVRPSQMDKRLLSLKSTGANEAIPSQGGFLVTSDIASGIHEQMWGVGNVLSRFNAINVSGNGLTINAIDETSRAAGSRMGGVRGYWMAEGVDKTASKPTFRQIELKLKKVAALVYATDELLQDTMALEDWINNNVPNELRFMVEDSIIDGTGIGMPLGILQSGALVSAVRTDANEVDADDIGRMWATRYVGPSDYVWFINQAVLPQLYRMTVASGGYTGAYMPPGGLSVAPYGTLLGRPVFETEYNPYLGTLGDILLASPSQYALITKGGVQSASSIHVNFVADETAFRFVYRVDGEPIWASPVTAFDGTSTISPFVALAATT